MNEEQLRQIIQEEIGKALEGAGPTTNHSRWQEALEFTETSCTKLGFQPSENPELAIQIFNQLILFGF